MVGLTGGREEIMLPLLMPAAPMEFFRRAAAHSPACVHLCVVSVRWSRQNVPLQDSQRKGRKSSWLQNSNWQCLPMDSRS